MWLVGVSSLLHTEGIQIIAWHARHDLMIQMSMMMRMMRTKQSLHQNRRRAAREKHVVHWWRTHRRLNGKQCNCIIRCILERFWYICSSWVCKMQLSSECTCEHIYARLKALEDALEQQQQQQLEDFQATKVFSEYAYMQIIMYCCCFVWCIWYVCMCVHICVQPIGWVCKVTVRSTE